MNMTGNGLAIVECFSGGLYFVKPTEFYRAQQRGTLCPLYTSTGHKLADLPKNFRPSCVMLNPANVREVAK